MAAKILAEVWDAHGKIKPHGQPEPFETFDAFYSYAQRFKQEGASDILRVHIPGSFDLSTENREKLDALSIERL